MNKVLFVATVVAHINAFHIPYLKWFKEHGWETHVAAYVESEQEQYIDYCDVLHNICFTRAPFTFNNLKAYCKLKKIITKNCFDIIHCHTPTGGALTRLAAMKANICGSTKVIYTAHGFHFYKGAPLLNWLIYYPIEKFLSRYTDVLITINKEDYVVAKDKMYAKRTEYIPGVGINVEEIQKVKIDRNKKREALGIPRDAFVLISVGELNANKNHESVIKALKAINIKDNIRYIIAGRGLLYRHLLNLVETYGLQDKVLLLGFRTDVIELLKMSDCFVFPSLREGLPVALMEAMACGLPVICSNIRGCSDLINDCHGVFLISPHDLDSIVNCINTIVHQTLENDYRSVIDKVDINNIMTSMQKIYFDSVAIADSKNLG